MSKSEPTSTTLSIDLKKYRIRVHKSTLHQLGDPQYIQLLVNPEHMLVAIRSVSQETSGDQTHRIRQSAMSSSNSIELYSRSFITKLCSVAGELDCNATYRMAGEVIPTQKLAAFSLKTLQRLGI